MENRALNIYTYLLGILGVLSMWIGTASLFFFPHYLTQYEGSAALVAMILGLIAAGTSIIIRNNH